MVEGDSCGLQSFAGRLFDGGRIAFTYESNMRRLGRKLILNEKGPKGFVGGECFFSDCENTNVPDLKAHVNDSEELHPPTAPVLLIGGASVAASNKPASHLSRVLAYVSRIKLVFSTSAR